MNTAAVKRLKCTLCRRGLLREYNVYQISADEIGALGTPVLYTTVWGYFYEKGSRRSAEVIEIAGELLGNTDGVYRLLTFSVEGRLTDLVEIDGAFYRIIGIRTIHSDCRILDLEVYPYEHQN